MERENSIAIKTNAANLKGSFNLDTVCRNQALEVGLGAVTYQHPEKAIPNQTFRQPFFLKRPHFSFEEEVRLYLRSRTRYTAENAPYGERIAVDLNTLINEIYVHPDAHDWFFEAVQDVVDKYNLDKPVKRGEFGNR